MEIEDQVQLAYIAKVSVEYLYEVVYDVEDYELVVFLLDTADKVEGGIPNRLTSWAKKIRPYLLNTSLYSLHSKKCVNLLERPITIVPIYSPDYRPTVRSLWGLKFGLNLPLSIGQSCPFA